MTQIVTSVTQFIGVLVMLLTISPLMTLVALCILPLSLIIVSNVVKRSQPFCLLYTSQGPNEDRTIDQSLDLGWRLLSILPREELDRVDEAVLEQHYRCLLYTSRCV